MPLSSLLTFQVHITARVHHIEAALFSALHSKTKKIPILVKNNPEIIFFCDKTAF
jgi:hypothetical protein